MSLLAQKKPRILIVDDAPSIHDDFRKIFAPKAPSTLAAVEKELFDEASKPVEENGFVIDCACQGKDGLELVKEAVEADRRYAMAFIDVRMPPGWDGIETVEKIWEVDPDLQVVLCTAYSDYSREELVARLGYSDRLLILKKPYDNIEVVQMAAALTEKWRLLQEARKRMDDLEGLVKIRTKELQRTLERLSESLAERERSEAELRKSEQRFRSLSVCSPMGILQTDTAGNCTFCNARWTTISGLTSEQTLGEGWREALFPADRSDLFKDWNTAAAAASDFTRELALRRSDGQTRWISIHSTAVKPGDGDLEGRVITIEDITERKRLEDQLRQSQKMEAIGQLAGGIAHDFNNILMVINGYSDILLASGEFSAESIEGLKQIYTAGERAANLTHQLLAVSRKRSVQRRVNDLNQIVTDLTKMLRRIIGENITLQMDLSPSAAAIFADTGMIEQVLLNLTVNARDAMPKGGSLTIGTEVAHLGEEDLGNRPDARAGKFVALRVKDSGCGMSSDTLSHLFEPFFTTKPVGNGTGLGLATVFGIVKQHDGWIEVQSQPGMGATFSIFFPAASAPSDSSLPKSSSSEAARGKEVILLVEDEEPVRALAVIVLQKYGYRVLEAASAAEALKVWERHSARINVLITDMVMPGDMTGRELAQKLQASKPQLKVIYTSGYSVELMNGTFGLSSKIPFLQKPYLPSQLANTLRVCIDAQ